MPNLSKRYRMPALKDRICWNLKLKVKVEPCICTLKTVVLWVLFYSCEQDGFSVGTFLMLLQKNNIKRSNTL